MQMIMSIHHEEEQASMETCNYASGHSGILKQTTETESSNFNANGAAGFAQLIRINEVDVMSVLTVSKTRKISLWLLMKMRTSLHGINKKVSMARALQLAGASLFLELQYSNDSLN